MLVKSFFSVALLFLACQKMDKDPNIPYSLNEPTQTFTLTPVLQEIS